MSLPPGYAHWLATGVEIAPPPPPGFDPRTASEAALAAHGLAPAPDARTAPRLRQLWEEMMRQPRAFVAPCFRFPDEVRAPRALPSPRPGRSSVARNWAGAVVTPSRGRRFRRVVGRWRTPMVAAGEDRTSPDLASKCSVWVGLDGYRLAHPGMPQIGTEHVVDPGTEGGRLLVWWQWWLREGFSCPILIEGLPVNPGDVVIFDILLLDARTVRFSGCNIGKGICLTPFTVTMPPVLPWPGAAPEGGARATGLPPEVLGASAEWIVERPRDLPAPFGTDAFFPLADFGAVCLEGAALMDETAWEPAAEMITDSPRLLRVVERIGPPGRAVTRARPTWPPRPPRTGAAPIRVEYLRGAPSEPPAC